MTDDAHEALAEDSTSAESKPDKKAHAKGKVKKADPLVAADPDLELGDIVIFTPTQAAKDSLRSVRGIEADGWAAMVTFVRDDGVYQLRVFRPFGLADETVPSAKFDPSGAPGTFRLKS